jgi:hypothetical protein
LPARLAPAALVAASLLLIALDVIIARTSVVAFQVIGPISIRPYGLSSA